MKHLASGSCLCGAVKFELDGVFEHFFLCHCSRCRKDSGSDHAANLFSSQAGIRWISGRDKVKTFQLPETRHAKSFCKDCGSALPTLQMNGALLVVPAGALDTEVDIRPDARICYASRAGWSDRLDTIRTLDGLPG
ncbi:GFA family protein [Pseudothioclava arenosa]|uniref:Aldehyde-activating protein n=1 Tax=Pseudothioclava arenosa TaxID=1795308 RepID=A0A2A4CMY8_9RHOB|nr:GFA family protein [Pseudothioclava arenosa]PCD77363.1 aldehyde-activating protein [Pseudothioclava arenosa]